MRSGREEEERRKAMSGGGGGTGDGGSSGGGGGGPNLEWRFNQTLRNVQGLLKGRSFPGKVLLTRRSEPLNESTSPDHSQNYAQSFSEGDHEQNEYRESSFEGEDQNSGSKTSSLSLNKSSISSTSSTNSSTDAQRLVSGARATDSARIAKFTKELSKPAVILEKLRELSWSGIPPYMRPNIWRLLLIDVKEFCRGKDLSTLTVFLSFMTFLIVNGRTMRSTCFARLLLIAQGLFLMLLFFSMHKFRNLWSAFCIHGQFLHLRSHCTAYLA